MTLSIREKILLLVFAVILIVFGGFRFLLQPALDDITKDNEKLSKLNIQKTNAQAQAAQAGKIDSAVNDALDQAGKAASSILPALDAESVNVWVVNLANSKGLKISNIKLGSPTSIDVGGAAATTAGTGQSATKSGDAAYLLRDYVNTYKGTSSAVSSAASSSSASSASSGTQKMTEGAVQGLSVSVNATGSYDSLMSYLDAVKSYNKTVYVTDYQYKGANSALSISLTLQFYGAEKPDSGNSGTSSQLPDASGKV